jgi:hypothetical protein
MEEFNYYYRVESLATDVPSSYGQSAKRIDRYVHIVGFNDVKAHESILRDYLQVYCRVDPDSDDSKQRHLTSEPFLCASAILTYYLRSAVNRRIEIERSSDDLDDSALPTNNPIWSDAASAIWLVSREENIRT